MNDWLHSHPFAKRKFSSSFESDLHLTRCRYKPDVRLRFVTEELGFESDEESAQFILDHAGDTSVNLLQEKDGDVKLLSGKAGSAFETARATAFKNVDIKGQI